MNSDTSPTDVGIYVLIPTSLTLVITLVGVLWKSGIDKGRDSERAIDTDRRLTRIERSLYGQEKGDRLIDT